MHEHRRERLAHVTDKDPAVLLAAVERLRSSADALGLPLELEGAETARTARRELVQQLGEKLYGKREEAAHA